MVTIVTTQQDIPTRSSSPHPYPKYPDNIVDTLLESLKNVIHQNLGLSRLPKALSTTMLTFDERNDKFEDLEDVFMKSRNVYPNISEKEQIYYFHSLLRGDALQAYGNVTQTNRVSQRHQCHLLLQLCPPPSLFQQRDANGNIFISIPPDKPSKTSKNNSKSLLKKLMLMIHHNLLKPRPTPKSLHNLNESWIKRIRNSTQWYNDTTPWARNMIERLVSPQRNEHTTSTPRCTRPVTTTTKPSQASRTVLRAIRTRQQNCRNTPKESRNNGNRVANKIPDPCEICRKKSHKTQDFSSEAMRRFDHNGGRHQKSTRQTT